LDFRFSDFNLPTGPHPVRKLARPLVETPKPLAHHATVNKLETAKLKTKAENVN